MKPYPPYKPRRSQSLSDVEVGAVVLYCRQCQRDPADSDGFCSDTCKELYDKELMDPDEGGEA